MSVNQISIVALRRQLYSAICQTKVLCRAFDGIWNGEVDEDEANGFTEGFSHVVDTLKDIARTLDDLKDSGDLNTISRVMYLQR